LDRGEIVIQLDGTMFIYGTAWKQAATTSLVEQAVVSGFRAIDTANQIKHYSEALVGAALLNLAQKGISREQLWIQTKFTSLRGQQDEKPPYDINASLTKQVEQSFASSLGHLHTNYLDSYLLHGPYNSPILGPEDFEVWKAIENIYRSGKALAIGVSNMNLDQMKMLVENAEIKPMFLQNRCYAKRRWDKEIRDFCKLHNIRYQGFSLLTANAEVMENKRVITLSLKYRVTPAQIVFRFAHQVDMIPLTGTTNIERMKANLNIFKFELSADEIHFMENIEVESL
jgi:diketogulonate reductase-like aldo/keto reductase